MSCFTPVLHLGNRNIPDGNVRFRRPWTEGWDIPVRKVKMMRIVPFLMFLSVIAGYIGEIGGIGTVPKRELTGNNSFNVRKRPSVRL